MVALFRHLEPLNNKWPQFVYYTDVSRYENFVSNKWLIVYVRISTHVLNVILSIKHVIFVFRTDQFSRKEIECRLG